MNEQQLQQILTIQQAIAAAATAAVINSLLNPQQAAAAGLANNPNALTDNQQQQQQLNNDQQDNPANNNRNSCSASPQAQAENPNAPNNPLECNSRIQDLLLQLQQHQQQQQQQQHSNANANLVGGLPAALLSSPLALNLNAQQQQQLHNAAFNAPSPIRSPAAGNQSLASRLTAQEFQAAVMAAAASAATNANANATTSSNNTNNLHHHHHHHQQQQQQQQNSLQTQPIKKLKTRHHQQSSPSFVNSHNQLRSTDATSKPQQHHQLTSSPKNHHSNSLTANSLHSSKNTSNTSNASSPSSSAFLANNVGLPRKLVRGQDVWLGRGAEQTRQILKCMWCAESFRTLAEMTQHMKITQHYTNIISQEQITSWRQPDNSDASSRNGASGLGKQSSNLHHHNHHQNLNARNLDEAQDDLSDKFDSDRDDFISGNDDDNLDQLKSNLTKTGSQQQLENFKNEFQTNDNNSNPGDSPKAANVVNATNKTSPKPLTRSRKREGEFAPIKREKVSLREKSPLSSSQNEENEENDCGSVSTEQNEPDKTTINGNSEESTEAAIEETLRRAANEVVAAEQEREEEECQNRDSTPDNETAADANDNLKRDENHHKTNGESAAAAAATTSSSTATTTTTKTTTTATPIKAFKLKRMTNEDSDSDGVGHDEPDSLVTAHDNDDDDDDDDGDADGEEENDMKDDEQRSETSESGPTSSSAKTSATNPAGGPEQVGDPLSALETMVEKSFDPRMRPGVANGGILQRLGIDEEVCPPWQHINYANWYAAAAYGHPMAAALLAAGLNLQNGIKLSKNVTPKKNED